MEFLPAVLALVIGVIIGVGSGIFFYVSNSKSRIRQSETEARLQLESARAEQKDLILNAKDEALRLRNEAEAQIRDLRAGIAKQEERHQRKEENLDRKLEGLERRERQMQTRERQTEQIQREAEQLRTQQQTELERISALSPEEARTIILQRVEAEARDDSARRIREIERAARDEADKTARKVIALAIQRCASDYVAEVTVSTVALPGEELKGRIIGREGRNIRAFEQITGVDIIVDDTPEAVTLSCHDPVRREVARVALNKLLKDGRMLSNDFRFGRSHATKKGREGLVNVDRHVAGGLFSLLSQQTAESNNQAAGQGRPL